MPFSGSYSTLILIAASNAASSSVAATAATGSPTNRTRSTHSACSSCDTGRIPNGVGIEAPVSTATTPGTFSASLVSIERIFPCATWLRCSLQKSIRGITRSSAKSVFPVTLLMPSTLRGDLPIVLSGRAGLGVGLATAHLAIGLARCAVDRRHGLAAALGGGALDGLEDLQVP